MTESKNLVSGDALNNMLAKSAKIFRLGFQWGFVPAVVYLGFRRGADVMPNGETAPSLTLASIFWG